MDIHVYHLRQAMNLKRINGQALDTQPETV
jgi:hypothetical protein